MPTFKRLNSNISAFLLASLCLYVPMAGATTIDLGGLPMLQVLESLDEGWWSALFAGVMVLFGFLFGRASIEMGGRLPLSERVLWLLVLIAGLGAGGVVLSTERGQVALLSLCALVLASLLAISAWRCRVGGSPGGGVFALASLSAIVGPVWMAWHGEVAFVGDIGWMVSAGGIVFALIMLGLPLLWAISSRSGVGDAAGGEPLPGMISTETSGPAHVGGDLFAQPTPEPEPVAGDGASRAVGLATPAMLLERIGHGMRRSERANVPLALLWVDVRGTPEVVRLFGDDAGEELLAEVARRLDESLRLESSLSRTGERCFAAVCEAVADLDEVLAIMNRLREKLSLPCELSDGAIRIDASFGHALFPQDGTDVKSLCRIAARRARGAVRLESRTVPMRLLEEHGVAS